MEIKVKELVRIEATGIRSRKEIRIKDKWDRTNGYLGKASATADLVRGKVVSYQINMNLGDLHPADLSEFFKVIAKHTADNLPEEPGVNVDEE